MSERRNPQRDLFETPFPICSPVSDDSFYARMGRLCRQVGADYGSSVLHDANQGTLTVPLSVIGGASILQCFDDVSDQEAANRVRFDLRWKLALQLPLDCKGFHYTFFPRYRSRLAKHGAERYAFDRMIRLAIEHGLLIGGTEQALNSIPPNRAAAIEDTCRLLHHAVPNLLLAMDESASRRRQVPKELNLDRYLNKKTLERDGPETGLAKKHLQELFTDAQRLLAEAKVTSVREDSPGQVAYALLNELVRQDIEKAPDDDHHQEILVILDVMMSEADCVEACRLIRQSMDIPVIILPTKRAASDAAIGLGSLDRMKADSYLSKPFEPVRLLARIASELHRSEMLSSSSAPQYHIGVGDIRLDPAELKLLLPGGKVVKLTPIESRLLYTLMRNAGKLVARDLLFSSVWGPEYDRSSNTLSVYIRRLRAKLEDDPRHPKHLITVRGKGYRFEHHQQSPANTPAGGSQMAESMSLSPTIEG